MKYKTLLLIDLLLTPALTWGWVYSRLYQFHRMENLLVLGATVSYSIAIIVFFAALLNIMKSVRLTKELEELEQAQAFSRQKEKDMEIVKSNAARYQSKILPQMEELHQLLVFEEGEKAKKKIKELTDYFETSRVRPICSHPLLNTILQVKKEVAQKAGISVSYQVLLEETLELPGIDLASIVFNLLDNGIEACQSSHDQQPFLSLFIRQHGDYLSIKMKNTKDSQKVFDRKTDKSDVVFHGLGLEIMEEIVEKYDGSCVWKDLGDQFQATLMLYIGRKD